MVVFGFGPNHRPGNPSDPGVISDVFGRVGGPNDSTVQQVAADNIMKINSGNVIIDHTWLWRADHDISGQVSDSRNPVNHALLVEGDYVTAYGLFAEHTLKTLVTWTGNFGKTYFYQSELPYDVT